MENKVVLITGASRGIGAKMAEIFAENGYKVLINYSKSKEKAETLANKIISKGQIALTYKADVSNDLEVKNMISFAIKNFGHIDVLINNAGICNNCLLIDETDDSIHNLINTNLVGTINCCKYVSKHMLTRCSGCIINISSIWGIYGSSNESIYSASKGGIISFTKALAKELAYNKINVNAIAPGVVETDMINSYSDEELQELKNEIPLKRFASTDEIAKLALYLSSENAKYITGQVIEIDGGFCL